MSHLLKLMRDHLGIHDPFTTERLVSGYSGSQIVKVDTSAKSYIVRFWNMQWADDFPQDLACQLVASDAGYGPRVYYSNVETGITVMEYLPRKNLPDTEMRLKALVDLLKKIHGGPPMPVGIDRATYLDALIEENKNSKLCDLEPLRKIKDTVFEAMRGREKVPCHRDLHPGNLLYTEKDLFVAIDYTWGTMDDPYVDLANLAVFNCQAEEEEKRLLELYLGRIPTPAERARLSLMKLPVKIFYGLEFLGIAAKENAFLPSLAQDYRDFGRSMKAPLPPSQLLQYAACLLGEVIDYSRSRQYIHDFNYCR